MQIDKDVLELFRRLQENGPDTVEVSVDEKVYNIEVDVYNAFTKYSSESPESFLVRIQPKDDDEASYLMSRYTNNLIEEGKSSLKEE